MGAVVICVVIIISALVVLATFPRKGGQRAPTREELAAAAARYRTEPGFERAFQDLRYRASADFRDTKAGQTPTVTVANAFFFTIETHPMNSFPPLPLTWLTETGKALVAEVRGMEVVSSRVVAHGTLNVVEVAGRKEAGRLFLVMFFGPSHVYVLRFFFRTSDIEEACRPLVAAMLDSFHFAEESLGVALDDEAFRSAPEITGEDGRRGVVNSPFPVADDTGRLLCKNCGTPFDTLTLDGARQWCAVIVRRDAPLSVVCRKCDTGSVFLKSDFDSAPGLVAT
jgi:hypothetical protein